ncbi:DUF192 domain-containing protein [Candidatus Woesearchaeota archaeon]|nr:DUF192 domain-containing protein [Candidatus Woesearchaeota archaeon]
MKHFFPKNLAVFLLLFLTGCAVRSDKNFEEISIDNGIKIVKINAEIADDSQEMEKGLMFREKLNENEGMLFIFDDENYYAFWMKNTLMPLDIVFIGKNLTIVDIKRAVPCREDPCMTYSPASPAKYVLEMNENFTLKKNVKIGDNLVLNRKILKQ